jgi:hypothetical protein
VVDFDQFLLTGLTHDVGFFLFYYI